MKAMALAGQSCKQAECVMWNALCEQKYRGKKPYTISCLTMETHPMKLQLHVSSADVHAREGFELCSYWVS